MRRCVLPVAVLCAFATGCAQLLGLSAPKGQQVDANLGDFTVQITTAAPRVPQSGFALLAVSVTRMGVTADIDVAIPTPPEGVTASPATLAGSATTATLQLSGSPALAVGATLDLDLVATGGGVTHDVPFTAPVTFAAGILDPSFGSGADGIFEFGSGVQAQFNDVTVASNGSITAVGFATGSNALDGLILRLTADGDLDPSFAVGVIPPAIGTDQQYLASTQQSNGNVIAAGLDHDPAKGSAASELTTIGRLTSFDLDGDQVQFFGNGSGLDFIDSSNGYSITAGEVTAVAALPDGELTILASVNFAVTLVRQDVNGFPATDFNGGAPLSLGLQAYEEPISMAIDAGSGLTTYVLGFVDGSDAASVELVHVLENGSLDPGFGSAGVVVLDTAVFPVAVQVQSDGNLLVGGGGGSAGAFVERLLADGSPDPSFGSAGIANLAGLFGSTTSGVGGVVVDGEGRIDALVESTDSSTSAVVRLLADGVADPTYGSGGISVPLGVFDGTEGNLAVQPNGEVIVVGPTISGAAIVRITD